GRRVAALGPRKRHRSRRPAGGIRLARRRHTPRPWSGWSRRTGWAPARHRTTAGRARMLPPHRRVRVPMGQPPLWTVAERWCLLRTALESLGPVQRRELTRRAFAAQMSELQALLVRV